MVVFLRFIFVAFSRPRVEGGGVHRRREADLELEDSRQVRLKKRRFPMTGECQI